MNIKYIASSRDILNKLEEAMSNFKECYYFTPENTSVIVEERTDKLLTITPEKSSEINGLYVRKGAYERDESILTGASPDYVGIRINGLRYIISYGSND